MQAVALLSKGYMFRNNGVWEKVNGTRLRGQIDVYTHAGVAIIEVYETYKDSEEVIRSFYRTNKMSYYIFRIQSDWWELSQGENNRFMGLNRIEKPYCTYETLSIDYH